MLVLLEEHDPLLRILALNGKGRLQDLLTNGILQIRINLESIVARCRMLL